MTEIQPDAGQPGSGRPDAGEPRSDRDADVVVLGAGPVGLAAALDLARRGVRVRVLEPAAARRSRPPMRGLGPRSLELFDDLGVAAELLAAGTPAQPVRRYAGSRVDESPTAPTGKRGPRGRTYPGPLTIAGRRVEAILQDRLSGYGVRVERVDGLGRLSQDEYGVNVPLAGGASAGSEVSSANGSGTPARAAYVILTDPLPDVLPEPAPDVEAETETSAEPVPTPEPAPLTYVGELTLTGLDRDDVLHLWEQGIALAPLPGGDTWWFLAHDVPDDRPPGRRTAPQPPTLDRAQQVFHERTGRTDVRFRDAASLVAYSAGTAPGTSPSTSYRLGRVLLAGDATGAHPYPLGGLDAGLQDVHNLGWKLSAALVSGEETALDTYDSERRPSVPRRTLFGRARTRPWHADLTGAGAGAGAKAGPGADQLDLHYRDSALSQELGGKRLLLHAGDRVPDIRLWDVRRAADLRLFDILRGPHWTLIGLGSVAAETVSTVRLRFGDGVRGEVIGGGAGTSAIPGVSLLDRYGEARHTLGSRGGNILVVRPDGYVGLRAALRPEIVVAYLEGMVTEGVAAEGWGAGGLGTDRL